MNNLDMNMERRLKKLNPELSLKYRKIMGYVYTKLDLYPINFPDYNDHSLQHSQRIIYYSNLLYPKIIDNMNDDEIFVYLLACCTHDLGMGIDSEFFIENVNEILDNELVDKSAYYTSSSAIRTYHNFISAYILQSNKRYKDLIGSEHLDIVAKLCIAHRTVDLYNKEAFPEYVTLSNGNKVRVTLLACMLRLADNLDIDYRRVEKYTTTYLTHNYFSASGIFQLKIYKDRIKLSVDISYVPLNENTELTALLEEYDYCRKAFYDLCNYDKLPKTIELKIVYNTDNPANLKGVLNHE